MHAHGLAACAAAYLILGTKESRRLRSPVKTLCVFFLVVKVDGIKKYRLGLVCPRREPQNTGCERRAYLALAAVFFGRRTAWMFERTPLWVAGRGAGELLAAR